WAKNDRDVQSAMVHDLADKIDKALPPDAVILTPRGFSRVLSYLSDRRTINSGKDMQLSDLTRPAFVIIPLNRKDKLLSADMARLGVKPGHQVIVEQFGEKFQFGVYELEMPKGQ
ncbi:MAG TPA: hypothetical protein VG722_04620, partial [Tepidisphaeraceae bacterium]|nr:hypothetical protein [Tepidisphaeraceae bacterium]